MKGIIFLLVIGLVIAGCTSQGTPSAPDTETTGTVNLNGESFTVTNAQVTWMDNPPYDATVTIKLKNDEMMMDIIITTDRLLEDPTQTYKFSELYGDETVVHDTSLVLFNGNDYTEYALEVWNEETSSHEKGNFEVTITKLTKTLGSSVGGSFEGILINRNNVKEKVEINGNFEGTLIDIS